MPKHAQYGAGLLVIAVSLVACSGSQEDNAPPVATPSVTLNRSDVGIGTPVDVTYKFAIAPNAPTLPSDLLVFVHFLNGSHELMWTDDHRPPTPTEQWKAGSTVEYTRTVFVPRFPYVGSASIEVGVYAPKTGERLPLAGEDAGMRSYRVGSFNTRLQPNNTYVVFKQGWHEIETSDGGNEWQWSRKDGVLSFKNPKRDAVFLLHVDQAVPAFSDPQQVDVRLGSTVVDSFPVRSGVAELRRIALSADQLGSADTVEMTVSVDKTFVPANVPHLKSADTRELGVRVFHAYVEPK